MSKQLEDAIRAGEEAKAQALREKRRNEEDAAKAEKEGFEATVVRRTEALTKDDRLYRMISGAVAKGETSFNMPHEFSDHATAVAIRRNFPDVFADYKEGYDHINSDEVKETWSAVTITWRSREEVIKNLRARYAGAYDALVELMAQEDPIALIRAGSPKDEYSPEVRTILPKLETCTTLEDVLNLVHTEFCHWFDPDIAGPRLHYHRIASRVFNEYPQLFPKAKR